MTKARTEVARVEIGMTSGDSGWVRTSESSTDRKETSYHALLLFCLFYAKTLFLLGVTDDAVELHDRIASTVEAMMDAEGVLRPDASQDSLRLVGPEARADRVYEAVLVSSGRGSYRLRLDSPPGDDRALAKMATLLYLQQRIDVLPDLELAYLALSLRGMHEYYETGQHWYSSKSLHPAPGYGITFARRVLERGSR